MKIKGYLVLANWLIFIVFVLAIWFVIGMSVSAFYHPNDVFAPYYVAFVGIWKVGIIISFLFSVILSIFRKRFSRQGILRSTAGVYGILVTIAAIVIIRVEPVPDYFTQSVGDIDYRVPREFTSIQNSKYGLNLDMCVETLQGIYTSHRDCSAEQIFLSLQPFHRAASPTLPVFFEQIDEFRTDGDRVLFLEGADRYKIQSIDELKSYTIDKPWDRDSGHNFQMIFTPVHFQVKDRDKLVRFVSCTQFQFTERERRVCDIVVKTTAGILKYQLEGATDFDLEEWQKIEKNLLNLISQWKVN